MHSTAYTFHIPTQIKNKAFTIIRQHGKTPAQILNHLLQQIADSGQLPEADEQPNATTATAITELVRGEGETIETANAKEAVAKLRQIAGDDRPPDTDEQPNATTAAAIAELVRGEGKHYETLEAFHLSLLQESSDED